MSILGRGDLVPRRRRGRGRWRVVLLVLVVLAVLGYAGYRYVWPHLRSSTSTNAAPPCRTPPPARPLPSSGKVSLRVRNSTLRDGLAGQVATALRHRGFHVHGVGNTSAKVVGTATVRYSANRSTQAKVVAAQVSNPVLVRVGGKGVLDLDLGPKWHAVVGAQAARATERADRRSARPTPSCPPTAAASSHG